MLPDAVDSLAGRSDERPPSRHPTQSLRLARLAECASCHKQQFDPEDRHVSDETANPPWRGTSHELGLAAREADHPAQQSHQCSFLLLLGGHPGLSRGTLALSRDGAAEVQT